VVFVNLKPWEERGKSESLDAITGRVTGKMMGLLKDGIGFAFNLPEIPGLGATAGVEANLQDKSGKPVGQFANDVREFVQAADQLPAVQSMQANFRANVPQLYVSVDRAAAMSRGVQLSDLYGTLQALLSTLYVNDFNLYGKTYRVQLEAEAPFRQTPADIGRLYVRGRGGAMVPVSAVTTTQFKSAPTLITRFNGFTSALMTGAPKPGHSTGEMMTELDSLVRVKFGSQGLGLAYSGQSYQERTSSGAAGAVLALGLVIVFLVLAAQYNSWSLPFAVLLGIPFGVLGAYFGVWLRGQPSDIYVQVGLITVVGLSAKNAILIVEFANKLRQEGVPIMHAAVEAARERLRPILMTSLAFILGVSPLVVAGGAGAMSRHSIGMTVFFGMGVATAIAILFIPLFFRLIRGVAERATGYDDGASDALANAEHTP
jgi:multidrug efflux pump subunit AcrB